MKRIFKKIYAYIQIYWIKIFDKKHDVNKIPNGLYCYSPKESPSEKNNWIYKVKRCPYYIYINGSISACKYCRLS